MEPITPGSVRFPLVTFTAHEFLNLLASIETLRDHHAAMAETDITTVLTMVCDDLGDRFDIALLLHEEDE